MNGTTLNAFFQCTDEVPGKKGHLRAMEATEQMAPVKEALRQQAGKHAFSAASDELSSQFVQLLDISIEDILVRAWNANKLFEHILNPDNYDPNESILLSLKKHTVTSQHNPHLDVTLNGKPIGRLDFRIDLKLILEGIILKIQAGRICEIRSGHVKGEGAVKSGEVILLKRKLCDIDIPGKLQLQPPDRANP